MGCGANLKVATVISVPAERSENVSRSRSRRRFKLPAEVLFGFQQVLKVRPRMKSEKRIRPLNIGPEFGPSLISEAITTREMRSEERESAGETLRGFKKNAGIIARKDTTNRRQSLGADGTLEVSWDEGELLSPEAPQMPEASEESVENGAGDWESDHFELTSPVLPKEDDWPAIAE